VRKLATLVLACALTSSSVSAATPSEGVPLQVRRGFFTETDIGLFWTLGGDNAYSNLQGYLQLGVGYQLTVGDGSGLVPISVSVGIGANAQNCWAGLTDAGACKLSDNFTLIFLNASAGYLFRVVERLYLGPKLLVGYTLLDPSPVTNVTGGVSLGLAASLEYATNMDHFSIGLDVTYKLVIGPNINAFAVYPRVQYTF
jgi:hypothetical protein